MKTCCRKFLRRMSGVAPVAASASVLGRNEGVALSERAIGMPTTPELESLRAQFPVLGERVNGHRLVYLDSAATTQRPRAVLDALTHFSLHDNANPAKSLHTLARRSATLYEKARQTAARFLHARAPEEIVWTRGTTEPINLVASSWGGREPSFRRRNHPNRIRALLEPCALAAGCTARQHSRSHSGRVR